MSWREEARQALRNHTSPAGRSYYEVAEIGDRKVFTLTEQRITRTDIWKHAQYKSRTEFERWQRSDPKNPNASADQAFSRILREKPHLKRLK